MTGQEPRPVSNPLVHKITPGLQTVYYYVTFACNLRCLHCYVGENLAPHAHADTSEIVRTLRECRAQGAHKVVFLGGETTLHPDYDAILAAAAETGYRSITVDTNGLARDPVPEGAGYLDRLTVRLSFDGAGPATHDRLRGDGTFQAALETVRRLVSEGVRVEVTLTLNAINVSELGLFIERFLDEGIGEFNFHFVSPTGKAAQHDWLKLAPGQILDAQSVLERFERQAVATVRYPTLLVPVAELGAHRERGCACRIFQTEVLLIFPRGELRRCPLEITPGLVPQLEVPDTRSFSGCPLWWRMLPDGLPDGYVMTCISWKGR